MDKPENINILMDELTDLPNRRYFDDQLAREWGRAIRETSCISLLVVGIDKFKTYSDSYGEKQGDELILAVAGVLKEAIKRPADFAARRGGDEFIMLMPHTDEDGAMLIAERIRAGVEAAAIPCEDGAAIGARSGATVSIGIHTERPVINSPAEVFVEKAEKALGAAKREGWSRICAYEEGM
jgi:diguanylate cyclase (GGDEF)-like protein